MIIFYLYDHKELIVDGIESMANKVGEAVSGFFGKLNNVTNRFICLVVSLRSDLELDKVELLCNKCKKDLQKLDFKSNF